MRRRLETRRNVLRKIAELLKNTNLSSFPNPSAHGAPTTRLCSESFTEAVYSEQSWTLRARAHETRSSLLYPHPTPPTTPTTPFFRKMGDPGMYTSARGKNKKGKESKRKDASNNAARKLNMKVESGSILRSEHDEKVEFDFSTRVLGIGSKASKEAKVNAMRAKLEMSRALMCSNPLCGAKEGSGAAAAPAGGSAGSGGDGGPGGATAEAGAGAGAVVLKGCGGCRMAQYCSVQCQKTHWPVHKGPCKEAAAAAAAAAQATAAAVAAAEAAAAEILAQGE